MGIRREIGQTVILEFTDEQGRVWNAGATITTLRLSGKGAEPDGRKQLREDDGLKLSGFKVVI
jgi:hypothetical protein